MHYYVRQDSSASLEGPFSVEEINERIQAGKITQDYLATSDLGDSTKVLAQGRKCDWFSIRRIPNTSLHEQLLPYKKPSDTPKSPQKANILTVVGLFSIAAGVENTYLRIIFWILALGTLWEYLNGSATLKRLLRYDKTA